MVINIIIAAAIVVAAVAFILWRKANGATTLQAVKEWLKYAVTIAEAELGSGTGQLKLRMVYDMFLQTFSTLAGKITFEDFSAYVDEALEWLDAQLESNAAVAAIVAGEDATEDESTETETAADTETSAETETTTDEEES